MASVVRLGRQIEIAASGLPVGTRKTHNEKACEIVAAYEGPNLHAYLSTTTTTMTTTIATTSMHRFAMKKGLRLPCRYRSTPGTAAITIRAQFQHILTEFARTLICSNQKRRGKQTDH